MDTRTFKLHYLTIHVGERKHKCHICSKSFMRKSVLRCHIRNLHGVNKHEKCNICGKCFTMPYELNNHIKMTHGNSVDNFKCKHCNLLFSDKETFQNHKDDDIHVTKTSSIECHLCKKLLKKGRLKTHINEVHETLKLKCDMCGKSMSPNRLRKHVREVHDKVKDFPCNLCDMTFGQSGTLERHVRNVHNVKNVYDVENEKKFQCRVCSSTFKSSSELKDHLKAVHIFPKMKKLTHFTDNPI